MKERMIVVCGATGSQGGAVVRSLLANGRWGAVAISRTPGGAGAGALAGAGVEVRRADPADKSSLVAAFRGAHGVFGVTQPWSPNYRRCDVAAEIRQGRNIVDACLETGVQHLVFSTVLDTRERCRRR